MPNIGPLEIIILIVIVLVIFGPKRLPELGRGLGRGMREFKDSITGKDQERERLAASNAPQTSGQAPAPPEQAAATVQAPPAAPAQQPPAVQQPPAEPAAAPAPPAQPEPAQQQQEPEPAQTGEPRG